MRSLICAASLLGILSVVAWTSRPAGAQDAAYPSIKKGMAKVHKGPKAPFNVVKAQIKSGSPSWSKVEAEAKVIENFAAYLTTTKAPKGGQASYEKLTKAYHQDAKDLAEAAGEKDLDKATTATEKLGASCKTCHRSHKR